MKTEAQLLASTPVGQCSVCGMTVRNDEPRWGQNWHMACLPEDLVATAIRPVSAAEPLTLVRRGQRPGSDYEWWQELPEGESAEALRSVGYEVVDFVRATHQPDPT